MSLKKTNMGVNNKKYWYYNRCNTW